MLLYRIHELWKQTRRSKRRDAGRTRRRFRLEELEARWVPSVSNEITALYSNGFTPTSLHLNGSATLAGTPGGTRLRLTDGGPNEIASAYDANPVNISNAFTTTFQFQFTPNGSLPLGEGFTFELQNDLGPETIGWSTSDYSALGTRYPTGQGPQVVVSFGTFNNNQNGWDGEEFSDNYTNLYLGKGPWFGDNTEIDIPKVNALGQPLIDFHSGHIFQATLQYIPPYGANLGQFNETIMDIITLSKWQHTYNNINLSNILQRVDVSGQFAYAGFTATTGSPNNWNQWGLAQGTQDILNWTWDAGSEIQSLPYSATFSLSGSQMTAGAVYDANGKLVRTLWQADNLPAGTYVASWDGMDQDGLALNAALNPGPYTFRVVENAATYSANLIANDTADPDDYNSSLSSTGMFGVAVDPMGTALYAGTSSYGAGDTAGGGGLKVFNGDGQVIEPITSTLITSATGTAVAIDSGYIYAAVTADGGQALLRANRSTGALVGFTDFENSARSNPDGSHSVNVWPDDNLLFINNGQYWSLRGIAVSDYTDPNHGSVWATDLANNLVHRYDKVTGDQIGIPIMVNHPTGIAIDDQTGDLWIAHGVSASGPADVLSVYDSNGNWVRDVTEASGLSDVWSLCLANGNLYVADNGAGHVLVETLSTSRTGLIDGGNPLVIGQPASFGHDDGLHNFWNLRGVAADSSGNIYTVQETVSSVGGAPGSQLEKWSPAGGPLWVKGGYEYQGGGGMYSRNDHNMLISPSLHKYELNRNNGTWTYIGSAVYQGYDSNKWSGSRSNAPATPPRFVGLGGTEFYTLAVSGNRIIFYRVDADGSLHPATIVSADGSNGLSDRDPWTWSDKLGNGVPQDNQIQDFNDPASLQFQAGVGGLQADSQGNLWFTWYNSLYKMPIQGTDSQGNPVYDWAKAVKVVNTLPGVSNATFVIGEDGIYLSFKDEDFGPESSESTYANYSIGGDNALEKFDLAGHPVWIIPLLGYSQDLDASPGGGVIIGSMVGSVIYQVTGDGQMIGYQFPLPLASHSSPDWLDSRGGALAVSRDPADGILDVFTEAIGSSGTDWYRIDDRTSNPILMGTAVAGKAVPLLATTSTHPPLPAAPALFSGDDSGAVGDNLTNVRQPRLTGTATPGTTIQIIVGGNVVGAATVASNGTYTATFASPLPDGTYSVSVQAVVGDLAGAVSSPLTLTIDGTPPAAPSVPALAPGDDSGAIGDGITNIRQAHLTGTAGPGATVQIVVAGAVAGSGTASSSGTYSVMFNNPPAEGAYSIQARAVDAAGNLSAFSAAFRLTIRTTAPPAPAAPTLLAADDSGTAGDGITNVNQPRLTGTATPGTTVQIVSGYAIVGWAQVGANGTYVVPFHGPLGDGVYPVTVRLVDAATNTSGLSPSLSLTILTAAPAAPAPALSPADDTGAPGDGMTAVRQPRLVGTTLPGAWVDLLDAHGNVLASATASATDGTVSIQLPAGVGGGPIALRFRVRDVAGNQGWPGPSFNLDIVTTPIDFDGSGHSDLGVFRPSTAQWLALPPSGNFTVSSFGAANLFDVPVPGDYDGTGHTEVAVFRPSTAQWFILGPNGARVVYFGATNLFDYPLEAPIGSLKKLGSAETIQIASASQSAEDHVAANPASSASTASPTPTPLAAPPPPAKPQRPVRRLPTRRGSEGVLSVALDQVGAEHARLTWKIYR